MDKIVTQKENEYTFTGLTPGNIYKIKVEAINENGKVEKETEEIETVTIKATGITINKTTLQLKVGEEEILVAKIEPENATNKEIEWISSDETKVDVDKLGKIIAKEEGTATITARTKDGTNQEASCIVTVMLPSFAEIIDENNYGEQVDYSVIVNGEKLDNWKIFYKDTQTDDIFIIYGDYLPVTAVPTINTAITTVGIYGVYWKSRPLSQISQETLNLFKTTLYKSMDKNYTGIPHSTILLNTENWNEFVDSKYADCAIGSPTLEMWCGSWNQVETMKIIPTAESTWSGYKVNNGYEVMNLNKSN